MKSILLLLLAILYSVADCAYIEDNGYRGVTISFSGNVFDRSFDVAKLKDVLKSASKFLYKATRRRSYFEEFILVVPPSWAENQDLCGDSTTEAPKNVDVYVTVHPGIPDLKAQHSKGCGEKGDIIYLPKTWLEGDSEVSVTNVAYKGFCHAGINRFIPVVCRNLPPLDPVKAKNTSFVNPFAPFINNCNLAFKFVQQWSLYRYGVFPENPEKPGSCIATSSSTWSPVGCYNVQMNAKVQFDENGLPQCYFPRDWTGDLKSSVMFDANSSKALDYCDGEDFPHNPVAPTLHNRLCGGDPVWSVVQKSEDFRYRRNLPRKETSLPKAPTFRCFKESKTHLTIMVENTDSQARSEIRYALYYFLSIIDPKEFSASLATFTSEDPTEDDTTKDLNLEDRNELKSFFDKEPGLNKIVQSVCLTCGLVKAYQVSKGRQYPVRTIILLAKASSLENARTSDLIEIIQSDSNVPLHLLFLEDTKSSQVPSSLEDAVQARGGRVFRLKHDPVYVLSELTVALLDASKNILHVEDKFLVVQKKPYLKILSDFADVVLTPKNVRGKLFYTMHCEDRSAIGFVNITDPAKGGGLPTLLFADEKNLDDTEDLVKIWRYFFDYRGSPTDDTTCLSLALLKLESLSKNSITIKGWLNEKEITPGRNVPIIYAEVYGKFKQDVHVKARITGPGIEEFLLELRDNGNGDPDVIKNDNIYSRYFMSFNQIGTYTVTILINASVPENTYLLFAENNNMTDMKLTQTKVIGTFRVTEPPPDEDIYPPNRVCDLTVTSVDNMNRTVSLQWTAPGDNYDEGEAKKYIIKFSHQWIALMDSTFNLKENFLLEVEEFQPASSGQPIAVKTQFPESNKNDTYYIALKAVDDKDQMSKISNIVQVHFKEASFPTTGTEEISSTTTSSDMSSTPSILTEEPPNNSTSSPDATTVTVDGTTTVTTTNSSRDEIVITKDIFIIAGSSFGAFVLILVILNIVICYCCFRKKKSNKPKKLSREASLRPPYNLNISYKHGSETSLDDKTSNSFSTSVDPANITNSTPERRGSQERRYTYHTDRSLKNKMETENRKNDLGFKLDSTPERRGSQEKRYTYHTDRSLKNKMERENRKNDLGFKLVEPMPAYATSSLSRFTGKNAKEESESISPRSRHNIVHLQKTSNTDETQVYPLGIV